jgi:uncharacterized membrane protein
MPRASIREAAELQRKDSVPDSDRTARRDTLADYLTTEFVNGPRDWQATTMTEIAEMRGCSRQFVSDTLDAYFEPAGSSGGLPSIMGPDSEQVPDEYREGYRDGLRDALQNYEEIRDWLTEE